MSRPILQTRAARVSPAGVRHVAGSPRRPAFTLFEALLAIVLILGLSGAVFAFLFNLGRQRESLDRQTLSLRGGAALFDGLEGDLAGVIAGEGRTSGIVGTETSLRLLTRGVAPPQPGAGSATLIADLQGVEYAFDQRVGTLSARRWSVLTKGSASSGDGSMAGDASTTLAEGVSRVRFRYFDGSTWAGSFDSAGKGTLPVAIEVALWFGQVRGGVTAGAVGANDPAAGSGEFDHEPLHPSLDPDLGDGSLDPSQEQPGDTPSPPPDRVRTIVIPDGPVAAWRAST